MLAVPAVNLVRIDFSGRKAASGRATQAKRRRQVAVAITLRYQGTEIDFEKSDRFVAIRARAGMADAMHDDIEVIAPGNGGVQIRKVGAFEVIDLTSSKNDIEQDLDWLRSRPAVAAASHVFHDQSTKRVYVPTGNIHLVFAGGTPAHQHQALLSQYRLQAIETRGSGDFLVSITTGSKNPIATASALQSETGVDLAEPEFAAL